MRIIKIFLLPAIIISISHLISAQNKYSPNAESLVNYAVPEWYQDAKLGYWVHWGLYSIPAYAGDHAAEWYGRWMYAVDDGSGNESGEGFEKRGLKTAAYHRERYGVPGEFGYKDFIPMFKANKFDADEWANLFADGGAKFFTMMGMHHDNYCLWDSENNPMNSVKTGPKRDFVREMERAVRKKGLKFGVSNHSAWNEAFFDFNHVNNFDAKNPDTHALYGKGKNDFGRVKRWWARTIELADKYQPDLYWFDWGWNLEPFTIQDRMDFCAWYYNRAIEWGRGKYSAPGVVVNYKNRGILPDGSAVLDMERGGMKKIRKQTWQNDTSLGLKSWSYAPGEEYRSANQVIDMLVDIVSKNGVLLLNIGPKADGSIPEVAKKTILEIGQWLKIYGEAIYATRPWEIYGEGPTQPGSNMHGDQVEYTSRDIRFTRNKNNTFLYITVLGVPGEKLIVKSLKKGQFDTGSITSVKLLGHNKELPWTQTINGFEMEIPSQGLNEKAISIKLSFTGKIPETQIESSK
ncbi:alpha-L-fucosidase [uncultured Draconibacterium sp.]|uniref:alpha-L-fucosidase n=1 Tax=uncultured Draconibacterium sp. TaxID=1573823 RepID=UPI0029C05732|nr:alpha-L-fucosidase [uncultured Draconibacterium sp.]